MPVPLHPLVETLRQKAEAFRNAEETFARYEGRGPSSRLTTQCEKAQAEYNEALEALSIRLRELERT